MHRQFGVFEESTVWEKPTEANKHIWVIRMPMSLHLISLKIFYANTWKCVHWTAPTKINIKCNTRIALQYISLQLNIEYICGRQMSVNEINLWRLCGRLSLVKTIDTYLNRARLLFIFIVQITSWLRLYWIVNRGLSVLDMILLYLGSFVAFSY